MQQFVNGRKLQRMNGRPTVHLPPSSHCTLHSTSPSGVPPGGVAGGSGGGGDEPNNNRPWLPKSAHEVDGFPAAPCTAASRTNNNEPAGQGPSYYPCPVCHRHFNTVKAVHGHMRVHERRLNQL